MVVSASPDATIRVWDVPSGEMRVLLRAHSGPITGLSLHATGDYVLSTSSDEHWAFSDIRAGRLLTRVSFDDLILEFSVLLFIAARRSLLDLLP
jgi:pre-mRNA-processing factor 19